jgi:SAM-dependent methyltransferase
VSPDPHLERWNARYAGDDYHFGIAPNAFLASQRAHLKPGMSALALADGEGRNGVFLAELALDVLSVDLSPVGVEKARRLAAMRNVPLRTECVDVFAWHWPEAAFDLVAAIFIQFADATRRRHLFAAMRRAAKPGGLLVLEGYHPSQIGRGTGGPPTADNLYTAAMLRDAFGDWEILDLAERETVLNEGRAHVGPSAVVDLVARKPAA